MCAEDGSAIAVGVNHELAQARTKNMTLERRTVGNNYVRSSEVGMADVVIDLQWHVEDYTKHCKKPLDRRRLRRRAVNGFDPDIHIHCHVRHSICVGESRRCWGVFDRNCAVLLSKVKH